jgi:hypothetical protein
MSIGFFDLPYGTDNPVDRPYISKRFDSDQTNFLGGMQRVSAESYEPDIFKGTKRRFKAYVLRIDSKQQEKGKKGLYVKVRAWCPETHPSLKAFKPESFEDHINIDKFPLYRAVQTSTPAPNPGEEIWVKYLNFENLQGLRYLEPVNEKEHLTNLIQSVAPAGAFSRYPCADLSSNALPGGDASGATKTFPGANVKLNKVVIIGTSMVGQDADGRGMMGKALNNLLQDMGASQVVQIGVAGSVLKQWVTGDFAKKKTKANSSGLSIASIAQEKPNVFFVALGGNDRSTSVSQFLDYARQVMNTLSPDKSIPIVWMGHTHTNQRAQPEKIRERYKALADTLPSEYPNLLMVYPNTQPLVDIYVKAGGSWHPSEGVHKQFFKAVMPRVTAFLGIQEKQQKPEQTDPITPKSPAQTPTGAPVSPPAAPAGCSTVGTIGSGIGGPGGYRPGDVDISANELSQYGPFAVISTPGFGKAPPKRYQLTKEDVMWAARMCQHEAHRGDLIDANLVLWSMTNLFALQGNRFNSSKTEFPTFTRLALAYSQPINPIWRRNGKKCKPGAASHDHDRCSERRLQTREKAATETFSELKARSPDKMKVVIEWATGRSRPAVPKTTGFARQRLTQREAAKTGASIPAAARRGNWHLSDKWIHDAPDDIVQMNPPGGTVS